MERPQFGDQLEAIKFICTDFWSKIFKKQIDTLRTDHKVSVWPQIEELHVLQEFNYMTISL